MRSSSPSFRIVIVYSAGSSVVASEAIGLALKEMEAAAATGKDTREASSIAEIISAETDLVIK